MFLFVLLILIQMKIKRSDQLRCFFQSVFSDSGRQSECCQVRHLFNVIILFYFIIDSLLHALLVIFHFVFTRIRR